MPAFEGKIMISDYREARTINRCSRIQRKAYEALARALEARDPVRHQKEVNRIYRMEARINGYAFKHVGPFTS